ncbi:hypothetical protein PGRAN_05041 [Listeria grandensis FSL F6-0971]|uniref:Uncharacterized protein n=1 Tax=Listeria grandensis FSL F6-0971 TaxID=1265819 RepID=W7BGY2_9LIST|nr:hypothetical protein PGRAN_05041 [Listeria grandensis FSL F6-0971]
MEETVWHADFLVIIVLTLPRLASMFFCVKGVSLKMLREGNMFVGGGGAWEGFGGLDGTLKNFYFLLCGCMGLYRVL